MLAVLGSVLAVRRRRWWPLLSSGAVAALLIASPVAAGAVLSEKCGDEPAATTAGELERYLRARPDCGHY